MRGAFYIVVVLAGVLLVAGCRQWWIVGASSPEAATGVRLRVAAKTTALAFGLGAVAVVLDLLARAGF